MVKLVLDANEDCLTENTLQSAFRLDTADIEKFKFLFQHRLWPPGLIQSEFRTLMRQRPPVSTIRFLLEQPATFVNAAEHFEEFALHALLESPRTNDSAVSPDLLDTILTGTVAYSSPPPEVPRSPWQYNKVDASVYQKVKVLLEFREIDVSLRNIVQAQGSRKIGRQIIQLFLDSPDRAKMSENVRKYAASLYVVNELTFTPKAPSADECTDNHIDQDGPGSGYPNGPASVYSDDDFDSVSSCSSSSDGAANSLDTLDDSDKRSRENEHLLAYHSLPFTSLKSGVSAIEPAWTHFKALEVVVEGM
jgi:hypothetical protein